MDETHVSSIEPLLEEIRKSDRKQESVAQWWENAHAAKHAFWLTGSKGPDVWRLLLDQPCR